MVLEGTKEPAEDHLRFIVKFFRFSSPKAETQLLYLIIFWPATPESIDFFKFYILIMFSMFLWIKKKVKRSYNNLHNILRLFDVLPIFPFTSSEKMDDNYL